MISLLYRVAISPSVVTLHPLIVSETPHSPLLPPPHTVSDTPGRCWRTARRRAFCLGYSPPQTRNSPPQTATPRPVAPHAPPTLLLPAGSGQYFSSPACAHSRYSP